MLAPLCNSSLNKSAHPLTEQRDSNKILERPSQVRVFKNTNKQKLPINLSEKKECMQIWVYEHSYSKKHIYHAHG